MWMWDENTWNQELPQGEDLEVFARNFSFNLRREEPHLFSFTGVLEGITFDGDEQQDESFTVGLISGTIVDATRFGCALDMASGYCHQDDTAFSVFFDGELMGGDGFDWDLYEQLSEEEIIDGKVMYIDEVNIHPQIASFNLGAKMVHAAAEFVTEFVGQGIPILAVLGAIHRDEKSHVVCRYFERFGFQEIGDSGVYNLLPSQIVPATDITVKIRPNPKPVGV